MSAPPDSPVHSNIDARFPQAMERAARVRLMIFDVDGVLTDGRLLVGPEGEISKAFDTLDGHGIKLLAQAGVTPAIITGRQSEIVAWFQGAKQRTFLSTSSAYLPPLAPFWSLHRAKGRERADIGIPASWYLDTMEFNAFSKSARSSSLRYISLAVGVFPNIGLK